MHEPFRFIHTSDLHLDRPPRGLAEVPDHLRSAFVDAPYRAAERVFDAAIKERVDFVVLAGDAFDPLAAGPRGLVFLADQFKRLVDRGIKIYWTLRHADEWEHLRPLLTAGEDVIAFPFNRVQRIVHQRGGLPLTQILGTSSQQRRRVRASDFQPTGNDLFAIAVAHGGAEVDSLAASGVNYWALGGDHDRRSLAAGPITAHYSGSPQGRRPSEAGPHGCTLVQVDEQHFVRTSFIATDAVRYLNERITVDQSTTPAQLHEIITQRLSELAGDPFGPDLLIDWTVAGSPMLASALRRGKLAGDLAARLRAEHGARRPAAWTVAIEPQYGADIAPSLAEEQTVLGEFLRTVLHYADDSHEKLNLEPYLAERHLAGSLGSAALLDEPAVRRRVLAEVARLGVELLGPQEREP